MAKGEHLTISLIPIDTSHSVYIKRMYRTAPPQCARGVILLTQEFVTALLNNNKVGVAVYKKLDSQVLGSPSSRIIIANTSFSICPLIAIILRIWFVVKFAIFVMGEW